MPTPTQVAHRPHLVFVVTSDVSLIFLQGQISHLRQAGFDVTCISSPGPRQSFAAEEGARVISLRMAREISPVEDVVCLFRLWKILRQLKPDIVNVGTPKAGFLGGIAARLARVPLRIYTLHGLRLETLKGWRRPVLYLTERIACACAHRVRAVSPSLMKRAVALKITNVKRMYVLGPGTANGLDTSRFQTTLQCRTRAAHLRRDLGIAFSDPVIGFVGRMTRDKGISELDAAHSRLRGEFPKLKLLLVGTFESACQTDREVRERWMRDPQVIIVHEVSELSAYYLLMNILLLPTYREGFPNVPLEAQAMGIPVITTNATGAKDSVQNGITGMIVPVRDAPALCDATRLLLENPDLSTGMGTAGSKWVKEAFETKRIWDQIVNDYRTPHRGGISKVLNGAVQTCTIS